MKIKFKDGKTLEYTDMALVDRVLFTNDGAELIDENATEYLYKVDGEYKLTTNKYNAGVIEVPKGAGAFFESKHKNGCSFFAKNNGETLDTYHLGESVWYTELLLNTENVHNNYKTMWRRATIDDMNGNELPFIDSEDTVKVTIDELRETLKERQSNYGDFKDVANTTQSLLDNFPLGRMSAIQKEALHMICSKLARIANGDPNHKDSWHDIAGYARLVEDSL